MAKARGSKKGTPFERLICHWLDAWWAKGLNLDPNESYFWRTAGSGARATVRKKKGKLTSSQDGDTTSVHPKSKWFSELFTLELKKGYNHTANIHDLLDKPRRSKPSKIEVEFIGKARTQCENRKTFAWMVIHMRDRRRKLIYCPHRVLTAFANAGCFKKPPTPYCEIDAIFRNKDKKKIKEIVCVFPLSYFLDNASPSAIKEMAKKFKKGERLV